VSPWRVHDGHGRWRKTNDKCPSRPAGHKMIPAVDKRQIGTSLKSISCGGEAGIRTLDTGFGPYNGLANRRLQPLGHLTGANRKYTMRKDSLSGTGCHGAGTISGTAQALGFTALVRFNRSTPHAIRLHRDTLEDAALQDIGASTLVEVRTVDVCFRTPRARSELLT
jgi:hypothetical protein